jgi:hypothetical protein
MTCRIIGTGLLLISWVSVSTAQQPAAPPEPAHKVYVLTGCLVAGPETPGLRLTGGAAVGEAPPARASSPGTPGVYLLQPVSGVGEQGISRERLESHVGSRVEVTVRPPEVVPGASTSSSANAVTSKGKPEETAPPRYSVTKINRLADSCG